MERQVSVVLQDGTRLDFHLSAAESADFDASAARHWLSEAFAAAELEPPNPMGKVLLVDQVLLLAATFKTADYAQATPDLRRFLSAASAAMGRPTLTIDLKNHAL